VSARRLNHDGGVLGVSFMMVVLLLTCKASAVVSLLLVLWACRRWACSPDLWVSLALAWVPSCPVLVPVLVVSVVPLVR
jgi:hypothetical protein